MKNDEFFENLSIEDLNEFEKKEQEKSNKDFIEFISRNKDSIINEIEKKKERNNHKKKKIIKYILKKDKTLFTEENLFKMEYIDLYEIYLKIKTERKEKIGKFFDFFTNK